MYQLLSFAISHTLDDLYWIICSVLFSQLSAYCPGSTLVDLDVYQAQTGF